MNPTKISFKYFKYVVVLSPLILLTFLFSCEMGPGGNGGGTGGGGYKPPDLPHKMVDRSIVNMEYGAIAFNVPIKMNIYEHYKIQLLLSLSESVDDLKKSIIEKGEKKGATIKVSNEMEARLTGYMFQITAVTPETQAIPYSENTEWKWEIHPKEVGKHELHVTLTAFIEVDGKTLPHPVITFDKKIEVTITAIQRLKLLLSNNWEWLWAAILVPICTWFWKKRKRDK